MPVLLAGNPKSADVSQNPPITDSTQLALTQQGGVDHSKIVPIPGTSPNPYVMPPVDAALF
jgi:hypothetical protein